MFFRICPHMPCTPKFCNHIHNHMFVITYSDFLVNVKPCLVKDSIQKYLNCKAHKKAKSLEQRKTLGGQSSMTKQLRAVEWGDDSQKMAEKDLETLRIFFNSAYYLAKKE